MKQNKNYKKLDYKKLDKVIALLDKVKPSIKKDKEHFDMLQGVVVDPEYGCGTIHCFAGWVYVAKHFIRNGKIKQPKNNEFIPYDDGRKLLSNILGLDLKTWAMKNPALWKNENGKFVFCGKKAFISDTRPYGAESLSHIRDHLQEVSAILKS